MRSMTWIDDVVSFSGMAPLYRDAGRFYMMKFEGTTTVAVWIVTIRAWRQGFRYTYPMNEGSALHHAE